MRMINQGNASNKYEDCLQTAHVIKPEKMIQMYDSDSFPAPTFKAYSGLTSFVPMSRKRSRDSSSSFNQFYIPNAPIADHNNNMLETLTFLNEDITSQMYQQQMDINLFIAHHTENVRRETEEMRRRNMRRIEAANKGIMKRLKTKEDEIMKIGALNWSLAEKVKSLMVENQIWRELAQTNEATAKALRNNLQQLLTQAQQQEEEKTLAVVDDGESCCGNNYEEDVGLGVGCCKVNNEYNRMCRKCGKEESRVLVLPCRHLCVCSVCSSSISNCPVCNSTKSAGVLVNITCFSQIFH